MKFFHIGLCATPNTNNGMQEMFKKHFEYKEIWTMDKNLRSNCIKIANEWKPDIIFMQIQNDNYIDVDTALKLKQSGAKVYNFTGDVRHPVPDWYIRVGKVIDCTYFVSETEAQEARKKGINAEYLQYGYDPKIYHPNQKKIDSPRIVFMANNYNHFPESGLRKKTAVLLGEKYPNDFGVYGSGWTIRANKGDTNGNQLGEAGIYVNADICISVSNYNYDQYRSDRMLKIMGSGAFCLSYHYQGIEKDYQIGKHLDTFRNEKELISKIEYYLNNPEERNRIAYEGYLLTKDNWTFEHLALNFK